MGFISSANTAGIAEKPLEGRVALVTGGSRGIGKAIVGKLAALGAAVGFCGLNEERLRNAAKAFESSGARILALRTDVTKENEIASLVASTEKQLGGISILVNNAGIGAGG